MRSRNVSLAILAALLIVEAAFGSAARAQAANPIVVENEQPGTTSWQLNDTTVSSDSNNEIKGYADAVSVNVGETIGFKVTVNPPQSFTAAVYRMGWYGGAGGRLMQSFGPMNGVTEPGCPVQPTTRLVECSWPTAFSLPIPATWTSGYYLVKLVNSQHFGNYIPFVVRNDSSTADLLVQASANTWEAYNHWGGEALYPPGTQHAVEVSFDRPYELDGEHFLALEYPFVRWLEKSGYDATYTTDLDTHASGQLIAQHKAFISVGHDEYWSWQMRDAVEGARDHGVSLAFFGGNDSYWQVRYAPSSAGVPNRVLVGYKEEFRADPNFSSADPSVRSQTTAQWRSTVVGRPEQLMLGEMFGDDLSHRQDLPYTVVNADSWVYAGTGVTNGQQLANIVGREYDFVHTDYAEAPNTTLTVLNQSLDPVTGVFANSVIYQAPSGAWVFDAGTMDWALALDSYRSPFGPQDVESGSTPTTAPAVSPQLQQVTANILDQYISGALAGSTPVASGGAPVAAGVQPSAAGAIGNGQLTPPTSSQLGSPQAAQANPKAELTTRELAIAAAIGVLLGLTVIFIMLRRRQGCT